MTKSSRQKRRIYAATGRKYYERHGKARKKTFVSSRRTAVVSNCNVQWRKSTRPIGPLKQLIITKEESKVLSTLRFEALPNEILFNVFSYLKIEELLKCGQVSKRLRAISIDLWPKKLNLCYKKVPVEFLEKLLDNGCKYLSLSEAILDGTLNLPNASRLKYLNLSGFGHKRYKENSEKLLESCYSLQKLSLSDFHLSSKLIESTSLQNGKTLKVLDLSRCSFCMNPKNCTYPRLDCRYTVPIEQIVENCTELTEFSLRITDLPEQTIDFLVSNLTSKIEKLDLCGMSHLSDRHVKTLVTRCDKITELNLGGRTSITKLSILFIIKHLQLTLVKLNFQGMKFIFDSSFLLELSRLKKLKFLCCDKEEARKTINRSLMKKLMPNLQINSDSGDTKIASPCLPDYFHFEKIRSFTHEREERGFWEIKAEREELFADNLSSPNFQNFNEYFLNKSIYNTTHQRKCQLIFEANFPNSHLNQKLNKIIY